MSIIGNLIRWITVDRPGPVLQIRHFGDGVVARVENLQPQGHHFSPPRGAQGIALAPGAVSSDLVTVAVQGVVPTQDLAPGEGGLHLLGEYKVFLRTDGVLVLGEGSDAAARASLVDARLSALRNSLDALITAYNGHIHVTTATIGLGPAVGVISATTSTRPAPAVPASVASEDVLIS